jgi:hypothetical protein
MAKFEMDYYVKKMVLIRGNANSRLMALCRIYVLLRDGANVSWRAPKLEAEKLTDLYHKVETLSSLGGGANLLICARCGTCLHGSHPCPFSDMNATTAKKSGRAAIRKLAEVLGE